MNERSWKVLCAIELVVLVALTAWAASSGGCTTQVELASGSSMPMKCFWTFRAATLVAGVGAISSLLALAAKTPEGRRFSVIATAVATIAAMLLPTPLAIGLCANSEMHCHVTALGVWVLGVIALVVALVQFAKADPSAASKPKLKI